MNYPPSASIVKTERMRRKNPYNRDWAKSIVGIVSQQPMIYDKRHSDYKNRSKKMVVWKEISNYVGREFQVNMTATELEKRWMGWKSTFISEHRRLHTPPVDTNVKKWYLFKEMMFMEPHISHHRKTFKTEESFEPEDIKPKTEYPLHVMKPMSSRVTRSSAGHFHDLSRSLSCAMDPCYLSQNGVGKSELADSTSTFAISQVVGNYSDHGFKLPMEPSESSIEIHDQIDRKPVCPDSSGLSTRSPTTDSFFKEEGRDKSKCIIEERLELVPLERRTMCLIEIFQVIHKYESLL
ncbi:uncharacterized protein LOC107048963 [Diachasma alloeum]|uniref:uncharacterized protein LOC107048963 n=1 Tax=Diachasma alloeum TaxID=454923 RepID=UPI000738309F|nr:uncharacterized protein LOC107048963 [Diachasma alloeum]